MGVIIPEGEGQFAVHLRHLDSSRDCIWTMGYGNPIVEPPANAASGMAGSLNATGCPYNAAQMGDRWVFVKVVATLMTSTGPVTAEHIAGVAGSLSLETPPLNSSLLCKKITFRGGRQGRGRAYVPITGVDEGDIDAAGFLGPSQFTAQNTLWQTWFASLDAVDITPVLHHEAGGAGDLILQWNLEDQCATQRRRMR